VEYERFVSGGEALKALEFCATEGERLDRASCKFVGQGHGVSLR
jgi:hypothetical protein